MPTISGPCTWALSSSEQPRWHHTLDKDSRHAPKALLNVSHTADACTLSPGHPSSKHTARICLTVFLQEAKLHCGYDQLCVVGEDNYHPNGDKCVRNLHNHNDTRQGTHARRDEKKQHSKCCTKTTDYFAVYNISWIGFSWSGSPISTGEVLCCAKNPRQPLELWVILALPKLPPSSLDQNTTKKPWKNSSGGFSYFLKPIPPSTDVTTVRQWQICLQWWEVQYILHYGILYYKNPQTPWHLIFLFVIKNTERKLGTNKSATWWIHGAWTVIKQGSTVHSSQYLHIFSKCLQVLNMN